MKPPISLFNENENWNENAYRVEEKFQKAVRPLIDYFEEENFSLRDVEYIMHYCLNMMIMIKLAKVQIKRGKNKANPNS